MWYKNKLLLFPAKVLSHNGTSLSRVQIQKAFFAFHPIVICKAVYFGFIEHIFVLILKKVVALEIFVYKVMPK